MPKKRSIAKTPIRGSYQARGRRFAVVVSRFNEPLTARLLDGALDTLWRHGARKKDVCVVEVPGAFEIPLALKKTLSGRRFDAAIVLAVVIRGQTSHFDQVVRESAKGVREVTLQHETPVALGIVSANTPAQAMERVGVKQMNKGREWALTAIEMANLVRQLARPGMK